MKWIDMISQAFSNLMRRKLRSALTMLGVVIGTAAIIVTISLGYGAERAQLEAMENMPNLRIIQVYPHYGSANSENLGGKRRITKINDGIINEIRRVAGVDAVTPVVSLYIGETYLLTGKLEAYASLIAVSPRDFAKIQNLKDGRYFSSNTSQMEFIMSEMAMMEFRDPKEDAEWINYWEYLEAGEPMPLPKVDWLNAKFTFQFRWDEEDESSDFDAEPIIKTRDIKARMVGTIKADMEDSGYFSYGAVVNLDWFKRFQRENKQFMKDRSISAVDTYDNVMVLATKVENVTSIVKDLRDLGLNANSQLIAIEQMREQIRTMQGFLGFIGMISMLVAALSIANTMMMSIYERTREIGVMKVLGCKLGNIRMMFLSEAAFIGIFGGAMGLIASYLLSYALNNVESLRNVLSTVMSSTDTFGTNTGAMSIIPPELAMTTWFGVIAVSILSGVQPAQRAMRLSSLAAIRAAD